MQDVDDLTHYMNLVAELRGQIRQWEPVIEAARAYKATFMEPYGGHGHADTTEERRALFDALKALEAKEE